jgi:hypothetical protein
VAKVTRLCAFLGCGYATAATIVPTARMKLSATVVTMVGLSVKLVIHVFHRIHFAMEFLNVLMDLMNELPDVVTALQTSSSVNLVNVYQIPMFAIMFPTALTTLMSIILSALGQRLVHQLIHHV